MPHEISLGPTSPSAALFPVAMTARREPARNSPVTAPAPASRPAATAESRARKAPAAATRIPAYRWRMMVALTLVVLSGFLLGMLLTALR